MSTMAAVVTGASRGIGRAVAERLARDYTARIVLVYRSRTDAAEAAGAPWTSGRIPRWEP